MINTYQILQTRFSQDDQQNQATQFNNNYQRMFKMVGGRKVYQQDISCVVPPVDGLGGIYIGNVQSAQNLATLKKFNIQSVLTSCAGVFLSHSKSDIPYYLYIPAQDHHKFDLSKYFSQAVSFIDESLAKTNILVHCMAGISRSVGLVIAYLIEKKQMSYDQAYKTLKARRRIIHPNPGFEYQLKKHQKQVRSRQNNQKMQKRQLKSAKSSLYDSSYDKQFLFKQNINQSFAQSVYKRRESLGCNNKSLISNSRFTTNNPQSYSKLFNNVQQQPGNLYRWIQQHRNTQTPKFGQQCLVNKQKEQKNKINQTIYQMQPSQKSFQRAYNNVDQQIQQIRKRYFGQSQNNSKIFSNVTHKSEHKNFSTAYDQNQVKRIRQNLANKQKMLSNYYSKNESLSTNQKIVQNIKYGSIKSNYKRNSKAFGNIQNSLLY